MWHVSTYNISQFPHACGMHAYIQAIHVTIYFRHACDKHVIFMLTFMDSSCTLHDKHQIHTCYTNKHVHYYSGMYAT